MNVTFLEKLSGLRAQKSSVLCVGLDPDPEKMPVHLLKKYSVSEAVRVFCEQIIATTSPFAVAYKINFAFFEALGDECTQVMRSVLKSIPDEILTIADAKRGDIGNSASFYAKSVFKDLGFDSVTVSPYMGKDSLLPFLNYPKTCTFALARTSNAGGNDFQLLDVGGEPLYVNVAKKVASWAATTPGTAGLVVGATDVNSMANLRIMLPEVPFLIPGVGSQGGSASEVMSASGSGPVLINSSRSILFASAGQDFAQKAAEIAQITQEELGK